MKNIVLARIDERLIHGQVATQWLNLIAANTIVVADDKIPSDNFMTMILKAVCPRNCELHLLTAEEAAELSQAALKLVRAINGETPVTEEEAREHLLEEAADVQACMRCIFTDADDAVIRDIMLEKLRRWENRINGEG